MPIRVQLYLSAHAVVDDTCPSEDKARRCAEACLDAAHHGTHGNGLFHLHMDWVNDTGEFAGVYAPAITFNVPPTLKV